MRVCRLLYRSCLVLVLLFGRPAAAQPSAPDPRFGLVESYVNSAAATQAGAGYTRVILRWDVIQPASPVDWKPANVPDPLIEGELAAGREVVGLLIGTPAWAAVDPTQGARSVPDMDRWRAFAQRMAQHYQGRIHTWIVWNEPDVWQLDHPGNTWSGSEEDYYRLLKTAYEAIKGVDPALRVTLAGLTYYWDSEHGRRQFLDRLLDLVAADPEAPAHGYYFDAVAYHLYFNPLRTSKVLSEARASLARHGIPGKEIWINETNAPPSADPQEPPWSPPRFQITLAEQAAFVLQQFALAFASGAARVEFYKLRNTADHPESIEPYGLLRGDDSRRPAFAAYQVATTYLGGFRAAYVQRAEDVYAVTFDRTTESTTVLWTIGRSPARVHVKAIAGQGVLVDATGAARPVLAADGVYALDLSPAGAALAEDGIGGSPLLLVEAGEARNRVALAPPSPSARPSAASPAREQPAGPRFPPIPAPPHGLRHRPT